MDNQAREKLCDIIAQYGPSVCDDQGRCEALVRDICSDFPREIFVIVSALKEGIPEALLNSKGSTPVEALLIGPTRRLEDSLAITSEAAVWTVESWALALGVISKEQQKTKWPSGVIRKEKTNQVEQRKLNDDIRRKTEEAKREAVQAAKRKAAEQARKKAEEARLSQGDGELLVLENAERRNCTKDKRVSSTFWITSSSDRGSYYEIIVEGHASCATEITQYTILQYRVRYDGSFTGSVQQSGRWQCPNCNKLGCIIVTACYGDTSLEVQIARSYRDEVLRKSTFGNTILDGYYTVSPNVVNWMNRWSTFHCLIKHLLVIPLLEYATIRMKGKRNIKELLIAPMVVLFFISMGITGLTRMR